MKNILMPIIFFCMTTIALAQTEIKDKHIILPRQFHVGQEFIYEGIPYIIMGYDQEKTKTYEKVVLLLERSIQFGFEFGTETVILTIKHGKEDSGNFYNTNFHERTRTYNWKAYLLGYLVVCHLFPPIVTVK